MYFSSVALRSASAGRAGNHDFVFEHDFLVFFLLSPGAAHLAGAQAIGVTTGIFTQNDLSSAVPSCVVFDDLKDTDKVLAALGVAT